jgi:hypothetical protein
MTEFQTPEQSGQAAALSKTYVQHPLSAAFPAMSAEDFQALTDSIDNIGIQNPITLFEGMVIDGWHRYSAALRLGMDCPTVELGDVDPREFVMAQNKARRHTTQAQLAMATTAVYAWRPVGNPAFSQLHTECAIAGESGTGRTLNVQAQKSTAQMAEIAGVHRNTIVQAQTVTAQAAPAVVAAVKSGELGLPKAAAIAKLPQAEQAAAISKPLPRKPTVVVPPPSTSTAAEPLALPEGMNEDDYGPSPEEIAASFAAEEDDRKLMHQMLHADDALATLHAEVTRLNAALRITNERFNGLMNEKAEYARLVKTRDWQIKKLHKEIDELRKQGGVQ